MINPVHNSNGKGVTAPA